MNKTFTPEEMAYLAQFEMQMRTAVESRYLRGVSRTAVERLAGIYNRVISANYTFNANCAACVLDLLTKVGSMYLAQKSEEAAQKTEKKKTNKKK